MFAFEQVSENALTVEKFAMLQERAENLTVSDAQMMTTIIIRKKFSESANKPMDNIKLASDVKTANLFGLKFE